MLASVNVNGQETIKESDNRSQDPRPVKQDARSLRPLEAEKKKRSLN